MQRLFSYIILLLTTFTWNTSSYAQILKDFNAISIFFGDKTKSSSFVVDFKKTKNNELISIQSNSSFFNLFSRNKANYTFDIVDGYLLPKSKPLKFYGNGKKTSLLDYTLIGEQILGLSYQNSFLNRNPELFYHFIHPSQNTRFNHGIPIPSFNSLSQPLNLSRLALTSSDDAAYAAALYFPLTSAEEHTPIKYAIIKSDYSISNENEFIFPYSTKDYQALKYIILDTAHQMFIAGHYINNKTIRESKPYFQTITITNIINNQLSHEKIESAGKFLTEVQTITQGENIILSGLYTSHIDDQIEGAFISKINNGKLKKVIFTPFPKDLLKSTIPFNEAHFNNKIHSKKDYSQFKLLDLKIINEDYLIAAEFNAVEFRYGGADTPGATNVIDTYYWSNDIIVCKIDKHGQLIWTSVIPKIQQSINDGGYFLSTASYIDHQNIHLFFNDNTRNYNELGDYIRIGTTPYLTQANFSRNTIAHITIDLKNGTFKRQSTVSKDEMDVIFVPRISVPYPDMKKLILYGRSGNKHRIGSISFNE